MIDPVVCWSIASIFGLFLLVAVHGVFVRVCYVRLKRRVPRTKNIDTNSKAMVVICLRGDDPYLRKHLAR